MRRALCLFALLALLAVVSPCRSQAEVVRLVKDLEAARVSAMISDFVDMGRLTFFTARRGGSGRELFRTDGTPSGTFLVADTCPGACSGDPRGLVVHGSELWFHARASDGRLWLWSSDGSVAGSRPLLELPLRTPAAGSGASANGLYFLASGEGLLRSDGTPGGTFILSHTAVSLPLSLKLSSAAGRAYYQIDSEEEPSRFFGSDGSEAGTEELGVVAGTSVIELNGRAVFFAAASGSLMTSDGTRAGTSILVESPATYAGYGFQPLVLGTQLLYPGETSGSGIELWRTDGTPAGTGLVADLCFGSCSSTPWDLTAVGGFALFSADGGAGGRELWRSDGTASGTGPVADIWPGASSSWPRIAGSGNGTAWLTADDGVRGRELWLSDGTAAGTRLVVDLAPGPGASAHLVPHVNEAGSALFAHGTASSPGELWLSDGSATGTGALAMINDSETAPAFPTQLTAAGGKLFLVAHSGGSYKLIGSDGSDAGTVPIAGIDLGANPGRVQSAAEIQGQLWFAFDDRVSGSELWTVDPASFQARQIADLCPGPCSSSPREIHQVGARALFFAYAQGSRVLKLWASDGTVPGTTMITDAPSTSWPRETLVWNGFLYYTTGDGGSGGELWRSDGTLAGTSRIFDPQPGPHGPRPYGLELCRLGLVFATSAGWYKSDGTPAGTLKLDGKLGQAITDVDLGILFRANDGTSGNELWRGDGSSTGGTLVADICPGSCWAFPTGSSLDRVSIDGGRSILFSAVSGNYDQELWRSDGTAAGTGRVADICPGVCGSAPEDLLALGSRAYFRASDESHGGELWRSDGSAAGTVLVADVAPGPASSLARELTRIGDRIYFVADDGTHGSELWVMETRSPLLRNSLVSRIDPLTPDRNLVLPLDPVRDAWLTLQPGDRDPEPGILGDRLRPLVYYALEGPGTLRLVKSGAGEIGLDW